MQWKCTIKKDVYRDYSYWFRAIIVSGQRKIVLEERDCESVLDAKERARLMISAIDPGADIEWSPKTMKSIR